MKIRSDYVSNSSSSSFIVISDADGKYIDADALRENDVVELPNGDRGCSQFGWQFKQYNDAYSKLNWAALVILSEIRIEKNRDSNIVMMKKHIKEPWFTAKEMEKMLKKVCKDKFNLKIKLRKAEFAGPNSFDIGYIDHQSDIVETPENARIFKSEKMLVDFLCNSNSYIDNGNDNEDRPGGWKEKPKDYTI